MKVQRPPKEESDEMASNEVPLRDIRTFHLVTLRLHLIAARRSSTLATMALTPIQCNAAASRCVGNAETTRAVWQVMMPSTAAAATVAEACRKKSVYAGRKKSVYVSDTAANSCNSTGLWSVYVQGGSEQLQLHNGHGGRPQENEASTFKLEEPATRLHNGYREKRLRFRGQRGCTDMELIEVSESSTMHALQENERCSREGSAAADSYRGIVYVEGGSEQLQLHNVYGGIESCLPCTLLKKSVYVQDANAAMERIVYHCTLFKKSVYVQDANAAMEAARKRTLFKRRQRGCRQL
ncbi:hypothetical protein ACQKWADRAFT_325471 [Trichoderma austrokoningii]